jgi:hypothetical protein
MNSPRTSRERYFPLTDLRTANIDPVTMREILGLQNTGFREGMIVTIKDASNLYISGGALEINGRAYKLDAQVTKPIGATNPDTLYYLYASVTSAGWVFTVSPTGYTFSHSLGADYMTGDNTKRWLANVHTAV